MTNFKKILKWIPAIIIFSVSFYLSSQETIEHMPSFWSADKVVHLICFAGLTFWVSFGCNISKITEFWKPVSIVSFYGILDELHQSFTPGRSCSPFDWVADTLGAFLGSFIYILVIYVANKWQSK